MTISAQGMSGVIFFKSRVNVNIKYFLFETDSLLADVEGSPSTKVEGSS